MILLMGSELTLLLLTSYLFGTAPADPCNLRSGEVGVGPYLVCSTCTIHTVRGIVYQNRDLFTS